MKETTKLRALELAIAYKKNYEKFHISLNLFSEFIKVPKSTLRGLFKKILPEINPELAKELESIMEENIHDKSYNYKISEELKRKVLIVANKFIEMNLNGYATIRDLSSETNLSKSTIHDYLSKYLPEIDPELSLEVEDILSYNQKIGREMLNQKNK